MKRSATAKWMGPLEPSQRRITSFFTRNQNDVTQSGTTGQTAKLSEIARKRRKTSSLLKPLNSLEQRAVEIVDLLDSDSEGHDADDHDPHPDANNDADNCSLPTTGPSGVNQSTHGGPTASSVRRNINFGSIVPPNPGENLGVAGSHHHDLTESSFSLTSSRAITYESYVTSRNTCNGEGQSGRIPVLITEYSGESLEITAKHDLEKKQIIPDCANPESSRKTEGIFEKESSDSEDSDGDDDHDKCLIRLTNLSGILETSQSSLAEANESESLVTTHQNFKSSLAANESVSSSSAPISKQVQKSVQQLEFSTEATRRQILLSPPSRRKTPGQSPKSASKTPVKTPKAKLTYFSPVRQLQVKSRSFSKTPPAKNVVTNPSPFKSPPPSTKLVNVGKNSPRRAQLSIPYYLKHFLSILDSVVADEYNGPLINAEDEQLIEKFRGLSQPAKCLFVRLAGRSWRWLRVSSVTYKEIAEDLEGVFQELHAAGFLVGIKEEKLELEQLLELIRHERLPELCKTLNIGLGSGNRNGGKSKEKAIQAILKVAKEQSTLRGSMEDILYARALEEVGVAYKLSATPRQLFSRIFILYRPPQYWEQESDQDKLQLLSLLLSELGKTEYPSYRVLKTQRIYRDRPAVLAFQEAWALLFRMEAHAAAKDWATVTAVMEQETLVKLNELLADSDAMEADRKLPPFLRVYVAGTLLVKACWVGIEGLQKQRAYSTANEILRRLLDQDTYCTQYRGRWYERLVLNSSTHLKGPPKEIRLLIEQALADADVGDGHKWELAARLEKIKLAERKLNEKSRKNSKNLKKKKKAAKRKKRRRGIVSGKDREWTYSSEESSSQSSAESSEEEEEEDVVDVVDLDCDGNLPSYQIRHKLHERTIEGEKMSMFDREHGKSVFLRLDDDDDDSVSSGGRNSSLSSVEQLALSFYRKEGFINGIHAEGAVPATLYGLLFWSVIYDDQVPDAFHSPSQPFPLDLFFGDFYARRKASVDGMLGNLRSSWTVDTALELMRRNWTENLNKLSVVNWSVFTDLEQLETLVRSMGLSLIAGICERLARNYRYYHSGFPDLILWDGRRCRIVEVKGPGDKLSAKQRLWLDYLISLGADVEVCHVKSVSNKRLRRC